MPLQSTIEPTPQQLERLAAADTPDPVVMLNLVRFRDRAEYGDSALDPGEPLTGAQAYARYGEAVGPFLERIGARVVFAAAASQSVIGPDSAEWDLVVAVQYPSRAAFLEMVSDPGYLEIHGHRAAALADSRLVACASAPV